MSNEGCSDYLIIILANQVPLKNIPTRIYNKWPGNQFSPLRGHVRTRVVTYNVKLTFMCLDKID